ncbi:MAG: leucyl/phenylalanyl-tRNA--protein transferase [Myxococcota bacterium]|nr:leucyl/phenylalanyl-tRNA--protein transferase [Myxococcota bacterium]
MAACVERWPFPNPLEAGSDGLLAYGGDLQSERLLAAYAQGIFPWYEEEPILWYSPDPRALLPAGGLSLNRSLRRTLRRAPYSISFDTRFREVIEACAAVPRPGQSGTWIGSDMIEAYCELHHLGFAHSVETWHEGELVGGIYGVSLGTAFFGESMFSLRTDASKVALVSLVGRIEEFGFHFLDCQQHTPHTEKLGAVLVSREQFLADLAQALKEPTRRGPWTERVDSSGREAGT